MFHVVFFCLGGWGERSKVHKSKNVFYSAYVCFRNTVRLLMEEILHHLKRIPANNGINYLSTG